LFERQGESEALSIVVVDKNFDYLCCYIPLQYAFFVLMLVKFKAPAVYF
jgi:hypothetical protein